VGSGTGDDPGRERLLYGSDGLTAGGVSGGVEGILLALGGVGVGVTDGPPTVVDGVGDGGSGEQSPRPRLSIWTKLAPATIVGLPSAQMVSKSPANRVIGKLVA